MLPDQALSVMQVNLLMLSVASLGGSTSIQELIDEGRCYNMLPNHALSVMQAQLLCEIINAIVAPVAEPFFVMQSDDGLWYELSAVEFSAGNATLSVNQIPVPAGTQPYRVLHNSTDNLNYKFKLYTTAEGVIVGVDDSAPTGEALTSTVFSTTGHNYELDLVTDGGITWELVEL